VIEVDVIFRGIYAERIPANSALQKCLNCAEAREKLKNLDKQKKENVFAIKMFSHAQRDPL